MKIKKLILENFRNIENETIETADGVNIIYGDNAQGKTNIIEGIWLFTGDKSFRNVSDSSLIKIGTKTRTNLSLTYENSILEKEAEITLYPSKRIMLNGVKLKSRTNLSGEFYSVIFSPIHLSLVKNGPDERRKFLDQTICQLKPKYISVLRDFNRVLTQRNSLLKDIYKHPTLKETLDIWDYHLARLTNTIIKTRYTYLEKLAPKAIKVYNGISCGKEKLDIIYLSKLIENENPIFETEYILNKIKSNIKEDLATGTSNIGAHRDDIDFIIDDKNARIFGSQGQQRSIVLALKLAECEMINETSGEQPIVLLDDVMSELDTNRQNYLLNKLSDRQIFITCCDKSQFEKIKIGKAFSVSNGKITGEFLY